MTDAEAERLTEQRRADIERAAYERGVAAEKIAAHLDRIDGKVSYHERRLDAINGSVEATGQKLDALGLKIDAVVGTLERRDAVSEALLDATRRSGAQSLTRWQRLGILATSLIGAGTLSVLIVQAITGAH